MNLFVLDKDIDKSIKYLCDKHIVKMTVETAQMLCTPYKDIIETPYKITHYNHPCNKWARTSKKNYEYLIDYGRRIVKEFEFRYKKNHKSSRVIEWCANNMHLLKFDSEQQTEFARAMPDEFKNLKFTVSAYRQYYKTKSFAKYNKGRSKPLWL